MRRHGWPHFPFGSRCQKVIAIFMKQTHNLFFPQNKYARIYAWQYSLFMAVRFSQIIIDRWNKQQYVAFGEEYV